jgi:hypothetical protein
MRTGEWHEDEEGGCRRKQNKGESVVIQHRGAGSTSDTFWAFANALWP